MILEVYQRKLRSLFLACFFRVASFLIIFLTLQQSTSDLVSHLNYIISQKEKNMELTKYIDYSNDGLSAFNMETPEIIENEEKEKPLKIYTANGAKFKVGEFDFIIDINKMDEDMTKFTFNTTRMAFIKYRDNAERAKYVSEEFDAKYGKFWNCIIGNFFGSKVYHRTGHYISFTINSLRVLVFENLRN